MREFKKGDKVKIIKSFFQHSVGEVVTLDKKGVARPDFWKDCNGYYLGDESYFKLAEEPKQEWVDGLPPVGCECEFRAKFDPEGEPSWDKIQITYMSNQVFAGLVGRDYEQELGYSLDTYQFRPLQTKEDKDLKARKEAVEKLIFTLHDNDENITVSMAHSIIKLGYHNDPKVKPLSDEEIAIYALNHAGGGVSLGIHLRRFRDYMQGKDNG